MALQIGKGETILFIGDSITDCGRRDSARPLGNGYVKMFYDLACMREPAKQITVINEGISGDRVTGLRNRWQDDVLRFRPDWLSIKIGINDLHSSFGGAADAVTPEVYRQAYEDILSRTRRELPRCRILLIEPFYISTETSPQSFRRSVLDLLPRYTRTVRALSTKYRTRLVRTHEEFQKLLRHYEPDMFCGEPVHPNATGHLLIAECVYAALSR